MSSLEHLQTYMVFSAALIGSCTILLRVHYIRT